MTTNLTALSLSLFALSLATTVHAADQLEEIIVTADFRDARLMSSAASISVLSEALMEERGAQHLEDILSAAPNISWSTGASRSRFIQIRGVGDLEQYGEPKYYPSVGIVLDDMELGSAANAGMLFDVAQVEVLRGPQGTRFGASAHAGMVNITANAPTDEFEAVLSGGVASYGSYNLGGVLSGPLSENVSARLAVQHNESDGYIKNRFLGRDDTGGYDEFTGRARLNWQASDSSEYDLSVFAFNSDNGYDAYSLDNDRNTWSDQPGADEQDSLGFSGKGQWQIASETRLQVVVSHLNTESAYSYDADWVSPQLCEINSCSGGYDTAQEIFDRERDTSTLDVRLLSGSELPLEGGKLGGGLMGGESRYVLGLYGNQASESLNYAYPSVWYGLYEVATDYDTDRLAIYGEIEFGLTDNLALSLGVRVERFEDDYQDSNGVRHDNSESLYNGELSLQYQISETIFAYATLAAASKPGGVNVSASSQFGFMSQDFQGFMQNRLRFDSETLVNWELGLKTQQLDGRLGLRAALFYSTRDNAQLESWMWDGDAGLWVGYLDSSGEVKSYGLELESTFALTDSVQLFANVGWLDAEVDSIRTFDLDENSFVTKRNRAQSKSPEYQYSAGIRARFGAGFSVSLEVEGRDESYFGYYHDGELSGYELVNGNLGWSRGDLRINVWARNLLDEEYSTHGLYFGADPRDDFGAWSNQTYLQLGAPRTYGLNLTYQL